MHRALVLRAAVFAGSAIASSGRALDPQGSPAAAGPATAAAFDRYCVTCHDGRTRSPSGPVLDLLDAAQIASNPTVWSKAYRQLQASAMPPSGSPRPVRTTANAMLTSIESALGANTNPPVVVDGQHIAERLAAMLWNSAPDPALLRIAQQNALSEPDALENFDPIGRWRTHDQMGPVDATGAFVDGTPIDGAIDLGRVLLTYPAAFRTTLTEKRLVYAETGLAGPTSGTPGTLVRARQILNGAASPRWSTLIAAVARAKPTPVP